MQGNAPRRDRLEGRRLAPMVSVLGPPCLFLADGEEVPLRGRRGALLAHLAADAGRTVSSDALVDGIWGEDAPDDGVGTLKVVVSRLRSLLADVEESDSIVTYPGGYRLVVDDGPQAQLDVRRFEWFVDLARLAAQEGRWRDAAKFARAALELWRGIPFEGFTDSPAIDSEARRLDEMRLATEETELTARLRFSEPDALIPTAVSLRDEQPLRERRWAILAEGLYRAGRQAEALRMFQDLAEVLSEELGILPSPQLQDLEEAILLQRVDKYDSQLTGTTLIDAPSGFTGRDADLAAVLHEIRISPLVTVTGLGGVGKTALARAVASHLMGLGRAVWFADMAEVADDVGVAPAVVVAVVEGHSWTSQLPGDPLELLAESVRGRDGVLFLDSAEHVIDGVGALVDRLLSVAHGLAIVVTSRRPLGVRHEAVFTLDPLEDEGADSAAAVLFRSRTSAPVSDEAIESICRAVGGIPLGIEIAAALTRTLPIDDVRARLTADNRSGALDDALDASFRHLPEDHQTALTAVAAFRGGFTTALADAIFAALEIDADASMTLPILRELGFLRLDEAHRYSLVEPIRTVAAGRRPDEAAAARRAHIVVMSRFAEEAFGAMSVIAADDPDHIDAVAAQMPNFFAAIDSAIALDDAGAGAPVVVASLLGGRRGRSSEVAPHIDRYLAQRDPVADGYPLALLYAAHNAMWSRRPQIADSRISMFLAAVEPLGVTPMLHLAHHAKGNLLGFGLGRRRDALGAFQLAVDAAIESGSPSGIASAVSAAYMAAKLGESEAFESASEAITGYAPIAPNFADIGLDHAFGLVAMRRVDYGEARDFFQRSHDLTVEVGLRSLGGLSAVPLGWCHLALGSVEAARQVSSLAYDAIADSGGWRIGEAASLLGAVGLVEGTPEVAAVWFWRALIAALRSPEVDIVHEAAIGLSAALRALGRTEQSDHLAGHATDLGEQYELFTPAADTLLSSQLAARSACGVDDLNHLATVARSTAVLSWTER